MAQRGAAKITFLLFIFLFFSLPSLAKEEVRFLKFNVHTQFKGGKDYIASYANYTNPGSGHVVIPAGTEINITKKSRKNFKFLCDNGDKQVVYEFHQKRMGMSLDEYLEKITSPDPVALDDLSKEDKKGVAEGKAYKGMTRKGVMTALGYPAAHRTPSLDERDWTYWTNRFGTIIISFDAQGLVTGIRD